MLIQITKHGSTESPGSIPTQIRTIVFKQKQRMKTEKTTNNTKEGNNNISKRPDPSFQQLHFISSTMLL